jgi:D-amino peptidase
MEGASGITGYEQAVPEGSEYETGRKYFMSDLLAAVKGLTDGKADEIHIYDEHCDGRNIDLSVLDEKVKVYCGKPPYTEKWAGGLDTRFDGLILLGFHSKRGTKNALLNHTYEPDIQDISVNGKSVGEIGIETYIAGVFGVPLVMITGDSEGIKEAHDLVPDAIGVTVKESLSEYGAVCYPLSKTSEMIYEAAKRAAEADDSYPLRIKGKVKMQITFFDTPYALQYRKLFGVPVFEEDNILMCWAKYWQNKLKVQKTI